MEINSIIFWNVVLSLIYAPLIYGIRTNLMEIKRIDILLSKTREEIPRNYVTKADMRNDMDKIFSRLEKIDDKIGKILESS